MVRTEFPGGTVRAKFLLPPSLALTLAYNSFALLAGVLAWASPLALSAQTVTFTGAQTTLVSGLDGPLGIAADSEGNVFIADYSNNRTVELPRTTTGYGPLAIFPSATGVAVDGTGDLFLDFHSGSVVEFPRATTGFGPEVTLLPGGLFFPTGIAADSEGDVFVTGADCCPTGVAELPKAATGYGPETILPFSGFTHPFGVAVDAAGDVFAADDDTGLVAELPKTATGYGPQATLPANDSGGIAVDAAGDVFIPDGATIAKLLRTQTGYGQPTLLPFIALGDPVAVGVDNAGNVLVGDWGFNPYGVRDGGRAVELQTHSVTFEGVNVCTPGQTTPAPCNETLTLNFKVHADMTLGTPKVLTGGAPNLDFTLASDSTCTGVVEKATDCVVNVTFAPLSLGGHNGSVEIVDGGGNVLATTLMSGYGVPGTASQPAAQLSTSSLQFGAVAFGSTGTLPLMITNIGGGTLTLASQINGQNYTIAESTCGAGVTSGNSCTLQVAFSPGSYGPLTSKLALETNGPVDYVVSLNGISSGVSVSSTTLQFGTIPFGSTEVLPLTVTNFALAGTVTVGTAINSSSYKILTTAGNTCLAGITAGQSCTLPVEFAPTFAGDHYDVLTLTPSGGAVPSTIGLRGTANGGLLPTPSSLEFYSVQELGAEVLQLTITNVGLSGTVTVGTTISSANYTILNTAENTCLAGIADGQSCTLPVEFSPVSLGVHYDVLTLTPSGGTAASIVHLEGIGVPAGPTVAFAGTQTTLPAIDLNSPYGIAVGGAGDMFIADEGNNRVVELPKTATGYGPQTTLPASNLSTPLGVAVDGGGDVFIADSGNNQVVELPRTVTGYGAQTTLPTNGLNFPWDVVVDDAGDVFIVDFGIGRVVELPLTATGYGPQTTLPAFGLYGPEGMAVDSAGDVFISDPNNGDGVLELPRTATGYGAQTTLPALGLNSPTGVAVDSARDVFIADSNNKRVVELSPVGTGYGQLATLPANGLISPQGVAVDSAGDVFIADSGNDRVVEVQTQSVNFGGANVCTSGQPAPCSQTLTLNFNVNADVTLGTPKVLTGGLPNLDFPLASGSTCTGAVVAGATCTVNVTFTPSTTGVRNGSVEIVDGSGNVLATTPIYGFGLANSTGAPVAEVSANLLQFGTMAFGGTETLPLTVTNTGGGTLIVALSINGQSFAITGSTCGAGVAGGDSCVLQVEFSPVIVGAHDDILTLLTNGPANPTIKLKGVASGVGTAIRVLNFGTIPYHTSTVIPLTITNYDVSGTVTIGTAISGIAFQVLTTTENTCLAGIAAGQSCTLPVEFSPTSVGAHNELLTLTPSGGAVASVVHLDGIEAAP